MATRELLDISKKEILTDARGYTWTAGELNRVIRDNVVAYHPNIVGQIDVMSTSRQMGDRIYEDLYGSRTRKIAKKALPISQEFIPFQLGRVAGNYIESQARILGFLVNLKKTGSVEHSAFQSKQFLMDYQNLTPFERTFMKRVIPFYTWNRKNIENQVTTLLTRPGRTNWFTHSIVNIGDVFADGPISDEERALLPEWMQDSINLVVKRNGENLSIINSLGSPFESTFDWLDARNLMGAMSPIFKGPIEQATGFNFFTGKPISQNTDATPFSHDTVPQALKDFVGYTKVTYTDKRSGDERVLHIALKPKNLNFLQNIPFTSRVLTTMKTLQRADKTTQQKLLRTLIGMDAAEFDLALESERREKELREKLMHLLDEADVGYKFERFQLKD